MGEGKKGEREYKVKGSMWTGVVVQNANMPAKVEH